MAKRKINRSHKVAHSREHGIIDSEYLLDDDSFLLTTKCLAVIATAKKTGSKVGVKVASDQTIPMTPKRRKADWHGAHTAGFATLWDTFQIGLHDHSPSSDLPPARQIMLNAEVTHWVVEGAPFICDLPL